MKNYYVMHENSQLLYRDTFEGCRQWVARTIQQWRDYGMTPGRCSIYYDTATEPTEVYE